VDCVIRLKLGRNAVPCERGNEYSVCVKYGVFNIKVNINCKKVIPLQARCGPESG